MVGGGVGPDRRRRLVGLGVAVLLVAACRPEPPEAPSTTTVPPLPAVTASETVAATEPAGGTFRYALQEPAAIVPPLATEPNSLAVVDALFDSLTAYDHSLRVVESAAISWAVETSTAATATAETVTVWTFTLRPDATFHDDPATPVTAADFKFSWEQAVTAGPVGYHLRDVEGYQALRDGTATVLAGVVAVDPHTLSVRLAHPRADFPAVVAHPALGPVPAGRWRADEAAFREQPVGNGPFRAGEPWVHDQFIRADAFEGWRNGSVPPAIDEVIFRISDPDTGYLAFQQGRRDFATVPPGALTSALEDFPPTARGGYRGPGVLLGPVPVLYFLGFNVTEPPFDEPEVRRAMSMAVNRQALQEDNLEGNVLAARAAVPPPIPGARPNTCPACAYDPAQARRIFTEHGVSTVTLWFNRGGGHEDIAQQVRGNLAGVGVTVRFRSEPVNGTFSDYLDVLAAGEAGLFRFGWAPENATLHEALVPLFHSRATPGAGGQNYMRYADAEVDALLDAADATHGAADRTRRYQQAEDIALGRDQVIVPLFTYRHRAVAGERAQNLVYNPFGLLNIEEIVLTEPE
ncbi:MAG: ABC transporter substrate-binding protein, partial [Euzebyaceae bacterium]|nr:ABC transporter substrate-binding protein [Euzebyaceae bacterium]